MEKSKVVISRKWNSPEIRAFVSAENVGSEMELGAFIDAVLVDLGSPAMILTREALRDRVKDSAARVLAEMKSATRFVV